MGKQRPFSASKTAPKDPQEVHEEPSGENAAPDAHLEVRRDDVDRQPQPSGLGAGEGANADAVVPVADADDAAGGRASAAARKAVGARPASGARPAKKPKADPLDADPVVRAAKTALQDAARAEDSDESLPSLSDGSPELSVSSGGEPKVRISIAPGPAPSFQPRGGILCYSMSQSLCMHVLSTCMQAIQQARVPETTRLGITLRGLKKLTARLEADFAAGRLQRPASVAEADWPDLVEGLRTEHVNVAWVKEVTKGSRKRLIELLDYVAADDVAPPQVFISHACEVCSAAVGMGKKDLRPSWYGTFFACRLGANPPCAGWELTPCQAAV
jgi:hypothetical protein